MNIPQNIDVIEIIKDQNTAAVWLAKETIKFINDPTSQMQLDVDTNKYISALGAALCLSLEMFINDGYIIDMDGMVRMLLTGVDSLMGMGYLMGYEKAKSETK